MDQSPDTRFDDLLASLKGASAVPSAAALEPTADHVALALEAGGIGLWTWNLRDDSVRWSERAFRVHGLAPDEGPPDSSRFFELVHPDDRDRVQATVRQAIANGHPYWCEFRIVRPAGETVWVENRGRLVRGDDGLPAVMMGTIQEVGDRHRATAALEETHAMYRALARNLPRGAVFVVGPDLHYRLAAGQALEHAGLRAEDLEGHPVGAGMPSAAMTDMLADYRAALAGQPFAREHAMGKRHYVTHGTPIADAHGRITSVLALSCDVTDRVRHEREAALAAERVQLALDAGAIIGTWHWDVAADMFTADELFARAFGLDAASCARGLSRDAVTRSIHPDDLARVEAAMQEALGRGGDYRCQYRVRRADGRTYWVEACGRAELDADGRPLRFAGVLLDIDERRHVAAERDQATALLRAFIDAVPGVVYAKDRQGRMVAANGALTEVVGKPLEDIIGRTDAQYQNHAAQAEAIMAADRRIMDSGVPEKLEERLDRPDGTTGYWLSSKSPMRDASGQVVGLLGASIDITDRREATILAVSHEMTARAEQQRVMEAQDRRKDIFLATLGHELRNPLASLSYGLVVLRERGVLPADGPVRHTMDILDRQVQQLEHLVEDLLDVSRINQDKIQLRREALALQEVVDGAVETARPAIEAGRHTLQVTLPEHRLELWGDRTRLVQALVNLLINAAKYSLPAGHIEVRAARDGGHAVLEVQDRGLGIAPEMLPRLWSLFSQDDGSLDRAQGGLGIGLALVRKLVELHGGSVAARSDGLGHGSTFTVRLPLLP